jgi:hypothetical protein
VYALGTTVNKRTEISLRIFVKARINEEFAVPHASGVLLVAILI